MSKFQDDKPQKKIELLWKKEEEESVKILSQKYKIPYADLLSFPIDLDALKILPEDKSRNGELVIFQATGKHIKIGVRNPDKEETKAILKRLTDERYTTEHYLISKHSLEHAWEFYKRVPRDLESVSSVRVSNERLTAIQKEINSFDVIKEKIESAFTKKVSEELEIMLAGSLALEASDIHLEPQENSIRLRYRIDGVLHDVTFLPPRVFQLLISRIKLVSELKLNIHEKAQDGRFTIRVGETEIEVRTSTLPGPYGENVVMRILNPKSIQITFDELGMQPWVIKSMEEEFKRPNGMILTTGPTGSGKTTALYAFVKKLSSPDYKIITIEDPIEYHLTGIEQTQIDSEKGYDFANGLRSILRQDPDVILVGEIRDFDTAETAMHAALTGHLVFSTLHTNSAAGTIPRLLDLGVRPSIIAPAINVAMAQRLVRKLCPDCKVAAQPTAEERHNIEKELLKFPKEIPHPHHDNWKMFRASSSGCSSCGKIGYKGRIGVFEIILIDEEIERLILKEPTESNLREAAQKQGQINMRQDGLLKVLVGTTDFAELDRVVGV